jgi:hypothetical protein
MPEEGEMDLYAIFRRNGWDPSEIEAASSRSDAEADRMNASIHKIRSYVLQEPNGRLGSVCLYEAVSPEALMDHARAAGIPCDEVVPVVAIDVRDADPVLTTA